VPRQSVQPINGIVAPSPLATGMAHLSRDSSAQESRIPGVGLYQRAQRRPRPGLVGDDADVQYQHRKPPAECCFNCQGSTTRTPLSSEGHSANWFPIFRSSSTPRAYQHHYHHHHHHHRMHKSPPPTTDGSSGKAPKPSMSV